MLQVVNLTKVYKAKGGVETRALDGVTLSFPEKGMVFLLGKSGSGKSTLLNVCGGLDSPTEGEIIVKGKSSKEFSQEDFDSYRNTYVGFVFQEYNILNEFSVEDNIALALELQGKPKNSEEIAALLAQVDLEGFAKRKPNTLSGGQKQRIAIARALIKNPEIIMADEPTGALDSATGRQVLETLKKLSESKLVIVVSHDREFALRYGDRIIELQDGKVLSDLSKGIEEQSAVGEGNVTVVGGNTLCVNDGEKLTEEDYLFIKRFLQDKQSAVITSGEKEIEAFKQANRITKEGDREIFAPTQEPATPKASTGEGKFIRSRLPFRRAVRIGTSSLKIKPLRLIFTVLLCVISFTMFGLFSTLMLYDEEKTLHKSLQNSDIAYLVAGKEYLVRGHSVYRDGEERIFEQKRSGRLTQAEVDSQKSAYGEYTFGAVRVSSATIQNLGSGSAGQLWESPSVAYLAALTENHPLRGKIVAGRYSAAQNEIVISEYLAQCLMKKGFNDGQEAATHLQEIVGKKLSIRLGVYDGNGKELTEFTVAGIFDCGYDGLVHAFPNLTAERGEVDYEKLAEELQRFEVCYRENLHGVIFVNEELQTAFAQSSKSNVKDIDRLEGLVNYATMVGFDAENRRNNAFYNDVNRLGDIGVFGKRELLAGETAVSLTYLQSYMQREYNAADKQRQNVLDSVATEVEARLPQYLTEIGYYPAYEDKVPDRLTDPEGYEIYRQYVQFSQNNTMESGALYNCLYNWMQGNAPSEVNGEYAYYQNIFLPVWTQGERSYRARYEEIAPLLEKIVEIDGQPYLLATVSQALETDTVEFSGQLIPLEKGLRQRMGAALADGVKDVVLDCRVYVSGAGGGSLVGESMQLRVAGIIDDNTSHQSILLVDSESYQAMYALSKQYGGAVSATTWEETRYVESENAYFDVAFCPYDHSEGQTQALKGFAADFSEEDSRIVLKNFLAQEVEYVNDMVEETSRVFMWVGIVVLVFSALLLSNFISVSISNKKKEIGILRAVGARGVDVFKIFFSESLTIALICSVLSLIASIFGCGALNQELGSLLSGVTLFVFGPASIGILLGVAIGTAALATFLPVYFAAKKKPVESIRAL